MLRAGANDLGGTLMEETISRMAGSEHGSAKTVEELVEIGAGIGRMTASFTRLFAKVIACDLDVAFLERCRETVAQFGRPERLQTSPVVDGRTIALADDSADVAFSYITFQHCHRDDALTLTNEAIRVVRPGGHVMLNYRTWTSRDALLWPAGKVVRGLWRIPKLGPAVARRRSLARFGWQANRLAPHEVMNVVGAALDDVHQLVVVVPVDGRAAEMLPQNGGLGRRQQQLVGGVALEQVGHGPSVYYRSSSLKTGAAQTLQIDLHRRMIRLEITAAGVKAHPGARRGAAEGEPG
jgi:SAM-dependent methyltransferase